MTIRRRSSLYGSVLGLLLAVAAARPAVAASAASPTAALGDSATARRLLHRVAVLASDDLQGRGNGTAAAAAAADTIARWFAAAGLEPVPGRDGWFQDFRLSGEEWRDRAARNVLGWLPGRGRLADRYVVVGAHYDHLGVARDSLGRVTAVYHGADDNASGVAVLVELAARLAARPAAPDARAVLFACFAGEEIGLQGSRWLAAHPAAPGGARPDVMLNIDTVGRLRDGRLYVGGLGSSAAWRPLLAALAPAFPDLRLELSDAGWDASDHVAFNLAQVPVLFLFTGPHPDYHTPEDTPDRLNPAGMARVADFAEAVLRRVLTLPEAPAWRAAPMQQAGPGERGKKRAWLGTIPDFTEETAGVRLAGVMPGGPAQEAGLRKGDVLVELAGEPVADLKALTAILQRHPAGETVTVVVERDGVRRSFRVTLRERPARRR